MQRKIVLMYGILHAYSAAIRYTQHNVKDENQMDALKIFTEKIEGLTCHSDGEYPEHILAEDLKACVDSWQSSLKELDYKKERKDDDNMMGPGPGVGGGYKLGNKEADLEADLFAERRKNETLSSSLDRSHTEREELLKKYDFLYQENEKLKKKNKKLRKRNKALKKENETLCRVFAHSAFESIKEIKSLSHSIKTVIGTNPDDKKKEGQII